MQVVITLKAWLMATDKIPPVLLGYSKSETVQKQGAMCHSAPKENITVLHRLVKNDTIYLSVTAMLFMTS